MEEIYIVKLKGLPPPPLPGTTTPNQNGAAGGGDPSLGGHLKMDSKNSFYYQDLTAEAIRGFAIISIFFGFTVLCLSVTNLCFSENPLALEPPLGITVWCAAAFLLLGLFGLFTAHKRRSDLSRSILYVKVHFMLTFAVLSLAVTFVILFAFDLHGPIANQYIGLNIFFSIIAEFVILLLTLFTCARVLWPGCLSFCAKDWPMQRKLKRKVIVKTNVFAGGIQQNDASMIQSVGPNCVISLNMPPLNMPDHHSGQSGGSSSSSSSSSSTSVSSSPAPSLPIGNGSRDDPLSGVHITSVSPSSPSTAAASLLYSAGGSAVNGYQSTSLFSSAEHTLCSSLYHSGVGQTKSYPFSSNSGTAHMQTFRKDPSLNSQQQQQQQQSYSSSSCITAGAPSSMTSASNRLLYEHSNFFKMRRSYLEEDEEEDEDAEHRFDRQLYGGKAGGGSRAVHAEEIDDPYDTDEFDYCTTDDDDVESGEHHLENGIINRRPFAVVEDCQKSSSDEGNGTLEEDNKSSTCCSNSTNGSDHHLSSSETDLTNGGGSGEIGGSDLYAQNGCRSLSEQYVDADHMRLYNTSTNERIPIPEETDEEVENDERRRIDSVTHQTVCTKPSLRESIVSFQDSGGGGKTDKGDDDDADKPTRKQTIDVVDQVDAEDEEEDDEGIASSGSSTCSAELIPGSTSPSSPTSTTSTDPNSNNPFSSRLRLQTYRSKKHLHQQQQLKLTPFKSSIRIESNSSSQTTAAESLETKSSSTTTKVASAGLKVNGTGTTITDSTLSSSNSSITTSNSTTVSTTPTIRLLTTKLSTPNSSSSNNNSSSISVSSGKQKQPQQHFSISSATADHPGSFQSTQGTSVGKLSSHPYLCRLRAGNSVMGEASCFEKRYPKYGELTGNGNSCTTAGSATPKTAATVNFIEPNRIPDIQRV